MTVRQQWTVVLGVVLLLAAVLGGAMYLLGDELFPIGVGSKAPVVTARRLDGTNRVTAPSDYAGKVVVLNVWATWCEPCRVEMPSLEKLHREFGAQGLSVVGVSVDDPGMESRILDFGKEYRLTFELLHDPARTTAARYQVAGFPETFVIARDGTIRKKVIGAADWSSPANRTLVAELLGVTAAPRQVRDTVPL